MIGTFVFKYRWLIVLAWLGGAGALLWLVEPPAEGLNEQVSFLPAEADHRKAVEAFGRHFPDGGGFSEAVVVFERRGGELTGDDLAAVERIARRIPKPPPRSAQALADDLAAITLRSPKSLGLATNPLTGKPIAANPLISRPSKAGQAALIIASVPANFITVRSANVVKHIRRVIADSSLPAGLSAAVTGSGGFGHDYALACRRSHSRTLQVTLAAVIIILLVVYRAPLAAMVPLTAISLAAIVATKLLALGQHFGMHVGTAEMIFLIVLLYGAGTDYSLLLISRYREFCRAGAPGAQPAAKALGATFPAILASAGTDTAGLLMLSFAQFGIFRTTGPAVAVGLVLALAAAVTLVPALLAIAGEKIFWPGKMRLRSAERSRQRVWPKIAAAVTARPALVLVAVLAVLAAPAQQGARLTWVYDTLADMSDTYDAARGAEAAGRHWPVGQISPVKILVESAEPLRPQQWSRISARLTQAVGSVPGVSDVRSLSQPVGKNLSPFIDLFVRLFGGRKAGGHYLGDDLRAIRMEAVLDAPAFSLEAMDTVARLRQVLAAQVADPGAPGPAANVHIAGATAEMIDVRQVTQRDFYLVAVLVLGVIFLMIFALLRDAILSAFMVASTVLSYLATLGLASWVFVGLFGQAGLDWKVEVFLFVVMVAVGVDYSIFLAARMTEEARRPGVAGGAEAVRRALVRTGPVISSCGVIMAATLGSLMAGDLRLLKQLGFALALGMLMDTFIVRPLLLPAFATLTRRAGRKR